MVCAQGATVSGSVKVPCSEKHDWRAVTTIVLGEALLTRSRPLAIYWLFWFTAANLFVIGYEEPTLHSRFGQSYEEYAARVGRWIPIPPRIHH